MIKRGASEYGTPLFIVYGLIRFLSQWNFGGDLVLAYCVMIYREIL